MKEFELRSLRGYTGNYTAILYSRSGLYYLEKRFLYYTKKQVIDTLRHNYDCVVGKSFLGRTEPL